MIRNNQDISNRSFVFTFVFIVFLASVLRVYQLNSQMWLDEFSALASVRRSWIEKIGRAHV